MKKLILLAIFLYGCNEPKIYECGAWDDRPCLCPNGEVGEQECSRGLAFNDPNPPRVWLPCSCCYDKKRGEHGLHYINLIDASGCWDDVYDPSIPTFEADIEGEQ